MTNQEILNALSTLDAVMFYRYDGHDDREGVSYEDTENIWKAIIATLEDWHRITGCCID